MADFDFGFVATYFLEGNDYILLGSGQSTGTLTDNETAPPDGDTFEAGDVLVPSTSGSDTFYVGTVDLGGGNTGVAVQLGSRFGISVYSPVDPGNFPPTIPVASLTANTFTVCFAAGTLIATPSGERAVESLAPGDMVLTADGRAVPALWIGHQTLSKRFTPSERFQPVRVMAGALGDALPHTDLVLTPDHALIIDGVAVNAGALVNGTSIVRVPLAELDERVTYFHVETAAHDVILANGAPAETYVDYVTRQAFDNYAEYEARFGDQLRTIAEMDMPRAMSRRQVPSTILARIGKLREAS
ncbi:MAG: Hint domain-containing protein [Pseudomonadota bacterium]